MKNKLFFVFFTVFNLSMLFAQEQDMDYYLTENLKMRDTNSLNGKVVEIKGCDFRCNGWVEQSRKIVFKGMVVPAIAKTVETETIDGITAPWYYIQQQEHDPFGRNEAIFIMYGFLADM